MAKAWRNEVRALRKAQRKKSEETLRKHRRHQEIRKLRSRALVADAALKAEQRRKDKDSRQHLRDALKERDQ